MSNPSLGIDVARLEFLRAYDPAVTYWSLSGTGKARVESNVFPLGIRLRGPGVMRILNKLGVVEEDELGSFIGLTSGSSKRLLKRLMGFGLVIQAR